MSEEAALNCKNEGNSALKRGDYESALKWFTEGIAHSPENAILYSNRSAVYAQLRQWENAAEDAKNAIKFSPTWAKAYSRLGLAYFQLHRYESSIEAYEKAIELEPSEDLKKSLELVKNSWKASESNVLGEEEITRNKPKQALKFFDDAVKCDPTEALYWSNRSHANRLVGNYDAAVKDADEVIKLRPQWHKGYQRKGEALYGNQKYDEAAAVYAYGLQVNPNNDRLSQGFNKARQEAYLSSKREELEKGGKEKSWLPKIF